MLKTEHLPETWRGRVDLVDAEWGRRLHQTIQYRELPDDFEQAAVLLGMASDEGVRLNQGRVGAAEGPTALRKAMANLCVNSETKVYDFGDAVFETLNIDKVEIEKTELSENVLASQDLSGTQEKTANAIVEILNRNGRPIVLGGGHEIAWASFQGAQRFLQSQQPGSQLGILNFDAHFDLRNPVPRPNSGTAFYQAADWCEKHGCAFDYFVFGLNRTANSEDLFRCAAAKKVHWIEDLKCNWAYLSLIENKLLGWLEEIDALYLSLDLDVFNAAFAPAVSAPAGLGIEPPLFFDLLQKLIHRMQHLQKRILVADVAELNPKYDIDSRTARLAARFIHQLL